MNNQTKSKPQAQTFHQNKFESPEAHSSQSTSPKAESGNVVEEFRSIGQSTASDLVKTATSTLPDMLRSLLGQPVSHDLDPSKTQERQSDAEYWRKRFQRAEQQREEEKYIIIKKQQQQEIRITQVREQIQGLTGSIGAFAQQIEITTLQMRSEEYGDLYTETFFDQLLQTVTQLRARINKASKWLAMHNSRSSKKGPFFKKGNQMQVDSFKSSERQVSFGG